MIMTLFKWLFVACGAFVVLVIVMQLTMPPAEKAALAAKQKETDIPNVKSMPFSIGKVMLSDNFNDKLKLAKVFVDVSGGSGDEWAATAVVVAKKVATFGADSIDVSVNNKDVVQNFGNGNRFRELAHATFNPDPKHSVYGGKVWDVYSNSKVLSKEFVSRYEEYESLSEKLMNSGMDGEVADSKAENDIGKKYNLKKDWTLNDGTGNGNPVKFDAEKIQIDGSPSADSLNSLEKCMAGKIISLLTPCGKQE